MTMTGPLECGDVGDRARKTLIIRRRVGPPRPVEEPKVPEDIATLLKRREPLIDRLDKIRQSANLQLSEASRTTLEEAIEVLYRLGWPRDA
jgi:hypothetical protein